MKSILLPHKLKIIGWFLFLPSLITGIVLIIGDFESPIDSKINFFAICYNEIFGQTKYFGIIQIELIPNLTAVLFLIGGLMIIFSKEKIEDEFINTIRLNALQWAVFTNYLCLLLAVIFVYGTPFFNIMVYNMFTVILIYIPRFYYLLWKISKTV
jgi:hypothetical protein